MINKPKLSVVITSLNDPSITKTFTKANGLTNLSIDGISNTSPYYGIISRSGSVEIIDKDGWLKQQSDNNVFPDISIDIYIDDILQYSFISDGEIVYKRLTKTVTINLLDTINSLQNTKLEYNLIYTDTNAYQVFLNICAVANISCVVSADTKEYLTNLRISKMIVSADTIWNVINQFVYGTRSIFYKQGTQFFLKRMDE